MLNTFQLEEVDSLKRLKVGERKEMESLKRQRREYIEEMELMKRMKIKEVEEEVEQAAKQIRQQHTEEISRLSKHKEDCMKEINNYKVREGQTIPVVDVIKLFFGGNLDFPKIKNLKKVCSDV